LIILRRYGVAAYDRAGLAPKDRGELGGDFEARIADSFSNLPTKRKSLTEAAGSSGGSGAIQNQRCGITSSRIYRQAFQATAYNNLIDDAERVRFEVNNADHCAADHPYSYRMVKIFPCSCKFEGVVEAFWELRAPLAPSHFKTYARHH
jgi:hypothetical protein